MVHGSLLKGLIKQLENGPWEQITMQGMYKCPGDTADFISQLQEHVRSRGGEEQGYGIYIRTAGVSAEQQCSTKRLEQRGLEPISETIFARVCIASLLAGFGIEGLLQPSSVGLG